MPLALSRTQDDKGRVRWTFFGGSEQGPAKAFWRSFYTAPGHEVPEEQALDFFRRLLSSAYGEPSEKLADLRQSGFRILTSEQCQSNIFSPWSEGTIPSWAYRYLWSKDDPARVGEVFADFRAVRPSA